MCTWSPGQSLDGFDEHSIYSELQPVFELVHGEELDVCFDECDGLGVVDAVSPVFSCQPRVF